MLGKLRKGRDPFWDDGVAAKDRNQRYWIESSIAFALSITACGLTVAMWIHLFLPAAGALTVH